MMNNMTNTAQIEFSAFWYSFKSDINASTIHTIHPDTKNMLRITVKAITIHEDLCWATDILLNAAFMNLPHKGHLRDLLINTSLPMQYL